MIQRKAEAECEAGDGARGRGRVAAEKARSRGEERERPMEKKRQLDAEWNERKERGHGRRAGEGTWDRCAAQRREESR